MCSCCCDDDCKCRPLGFLLGLPFAFLSLVISLVGIIIWIVGFKLKLTLQIAAKAYSAVHDQTRLVLSCICPCCLCVTVIVELALGLIKAPILVMKWFAEQIPC